MNFRIKFLVILMVLGLLVPASSLLAKQDGVKILVPTGADQPPKEVYVGGADQKQPEVNDLTKSYEIWKNKGIKFVVRDKSGKLIDWGVGRLESWGSTSKWVVRNKKGQFLTNAFGRVEHWKNGKIRLVLRTPKGHLLTHIPIDLTSKASFAHNVVGLRKLNADHKYISFVQETLGELLVKDLKANDTIKTKVLLDYIKKYKTQKSGMKNFVPVLRLVLRQLNFMAAQSDDSVIKSLATAAREMLAALT